MLVPKYGTPLIDINCDWLIFFFQYGGGGYVGGGYGVGGYGGQVISLGKINFGKLG